LLLKDNIFRSTDPNTQKTAIYIYLNGSEPELLNNRMDGHPMGEVVHEKANK
jgi:hypothetical protein